MRIDPLTLTMADHNTRKVRPMCDYRFNNDDPTSFCKRAPAFWVQSLMSTHNMLACAHHLARIVRDIDEAAKPYDTVRSQETAANYPDGGDERYTRTDKRRLRMTKEDSNYAHVTVKPYTRH